MQKNVINKESNKEFDEYDETEAVREEGYPALCKSRGEVECDENSA